MRALAVAVAMAAALAEARASVGAEGLGTGSRVRVAGLGIPDGAAEATLLGRVTGRVVSTDDETLQVERADGSRVRFRQDSLRLLQTSNGPRSPVGGALRGGLVAGAFGAGLGLLIGPRWNLEEEGHARVAGQFALGAAIVGLVAGALAPGEHWSRVESGRARVSVAPTTGPRGQGAGLTVAVGF